ncbi:hypothetical protein VNO78_21984 [Psophocarpus tetragonolobus]|uniref:Uncharacterized protein n=1 Tax=Psophocarpus tetragonolobus TaxID=3891 RepID=A0AAN9XIS4_PSOTE
MYFSGHKNVSDVAKQPYQFESTVMVLNNCLNELKLWKVFIGFNHHELLVFASNLVLAGRTTLPTSVENGTVFSVAPPSVLMRKSINLAYDGFLSP